MDINGIGYLGFESTKLDEWRTYGPEVMGFQVNKNEADPASLYFKLDDRRHRFAFHPGKIDRLAYIGWEARGRLEYLAGIEKLKAAGIPLVAGDPALCQLRGVKELIRFRDPVGYQHELFYAQKWSPRSFVPGRPHGGFLCGQRGMGHVVVMTPEYPPDLERFLIDVMGFSWYGSGAGKGKTGFFRAKLNTFSSHDIAYGHAPGRMGVQHVGLFVKTVRDVGETYDLVKKRNLPLMMKLGQHTQDPHMSFYHFNPSGFAFECIVELEPWHPDGFELNPESLSTWGHELVGPILGPSVRTPDEVLDAEYLESRKSRG